MNYRSRDYLASRRRWWARKNLARQEAKPPAIRAMNYARRWTTSILQEARAVRADG